MSASPSSGAMYELAGETGLGVVRVVSDGGYGMAWSLPFCPRWRAYVSLAAAVLPSQALPVPSVLRLHLNR